LAPLSCQIDGSARADVPEFDLNEPFTLSGGQVGLIPSENLQLRFTDIPEDSRCPTQVECFWTGQARIAISVQPGGADPTTVEFNTNPAPSQTVKTVQVGRYGIELQTLDPYPQTPDPVAFEDYRATLVVRMR
jgi:nitrogen fixation protein